MQKSLQASQQEGPSLVVAPSKGRPAQLDSKPGRSTRAGLEAWQKAIRAFGSWISPPVQDVPRGNNRQGKVGTTTGLGSERESTTASGLGVRGLLGGGVVKPVVPTLGGKLKQFLRVQQLLTVLARRAGCERVSPSRKRCLNLEWVTRTCLINDNAVSYV